MRKCQHNLGVARWRTVDVVNHPRQTMRRTSQALVLTILMLSSGCLGLLGGEENTDSKEEDAGAPPSLSIRESGPYSHNQNVVIDGDVSDESIETVEIKGTMANGAISGSIIRGRLVAGSGLGIV